MQCCPVQLSRCHATVDTSGVSAVNYSYPEKKQHQLIFGYSVAYSSHLYVPFGIVVVICNKLLQFCLLCAMLFYCFSVVIFCKIVFNKF